MEVSSPFQILTLIVAPAVLTNSSSVLSLSTSNRFARTVDRSRAIYDKLKKPETLTDTERAMFEKQLPIIGQRSLLLVRALTSFYVSVGSFAATAFLSLIGAGLEMFGHPSFSRVLTGVAMFTGCVGVLGLVIGTGLLVRETWVALHFLRIEVQSSEAVMASPIL